MSNRSAILNNPSLKDLLDNNLIEIANYLMTCSTFLFYAVTSSANELDKCIKIIVDINKKTSFINNPEAIKKTSKIKERFKSQEDRSESNPDNISKEDFNTVVTFIQEKLEELEQLIQQLEKSEELKNNRYSEHKDLLNDLRDSLKKIIGMKQQTYSDYTPESVRTDSFKTVSECTSNNSCSSFDGSGFGSVADDEFYDPDSDSESDSDTSEAYFDMTDSGDDSDSDTSEVEFDTTNLPDDPDSCRPQWPSRSQLFSYKAKRNEDKVSDDENQSPVLNV